MKHPITRDIILDLLPLYLADELSRDSTELVRNYLESDPELAEMAKEMAVVESLSRTPIPYDKEMALRTFEQNRKWAVIKTLGIAAIIGLVLMCFFLAVAVGSSVESWANRL
jgi:Fe2+ transport system protein B